MIDLGKIHETPELHVPIVDASDVCTPKPRLEFSWNRHSTSLLLLKQKISPRVEKDQCGRYTSECWQAKSRNIRPFQLVELGQFAVHHCRQERKYWSSWVCVQTAGTTRLASSATAAMNMPRSLNNQWGQHSTGETSVLRISFRNRQFLRGKVTRFDSRYPIPHRRFPLRKDVRSVEFASRPIDGSTAPVVIRRQQTPVKRSSVKVGVGRIASLDGLVVFSSKIIPIRKKVRSVCNSVCVTRVQCSHFSARLGLSNDWITSWGVD